MWEILSHLLYVYFIAIDRIIYSVIAYMLFNLNLSFQDDAQQKYVDYVKDLEGKQIPFWRYVTW